MLRFPLILLGRQNFRNLEYSALGFRKQNATQQSRPCQHNLLQAAAFLCLGTSLGCEAPWLEPTSSAPAASSHLRSGRERWWFSMCSHQGMTRLCWMERHRAELKVAETNYTAGNRGDSTLNCRKCFPWWARAMAALCSPPHISCLTLHSHVGLLQSNGYLSASSGIQK